MLEFDIFSIKDEEKNRAVIGLLGLLKKRESELKERDAEVAKLREEIARLKNHPLKPKLKPSMISKKDKSIRNKKKSHLGNSTQKGKSKKIEIHEIKDNTLSIENQCLHNLLMQRVLW